MSNTINRLNKQHIDEGITKFMNEHNINRIRKIYGGQTVLTLEKRLNFHKSTEPTIFNNMKIINLFYLNKEGINVCVKTSNIAQAKLMEQHLIDTLKEKYGFKLTNKTMHAGGGESQDNIPHYMYIAYEEVLFEFV